MDVENPMVIDSVWPDYDELDKEMRDEIEKQKEDLDYCEDFRWRQVE